MGLDLVYMNQESRHGDEALEARWSYSGFMQFRVKLCKAIGYGDLGDYNGFGGSVPWPTPKDQLYSPINHLLNHSDCDGELTAEQCKEMAQPFREVIEKWPEGDYDREMGQRFADMMDACAERGGVIGFY